MKYRSALLLTAPDVDTGPALAALQRVAPRLEHLLLVVHLPVPSFAWLSGNAATAPDAATMASVEALRVAAAEAAPAARVEVQLAPELGAMALMELAIVADADLLVAGSRSRKTKAVLGDLGKRLSLAVLWPAAEVRSGPVREITCVAFAAQDRASIAAFLRDQGDPTLHVTVRAPGPPAEDLDLILEVAGIDADVELAGLSFRAWLTSATSGTPIDLLVLGHAPMVFLSVEPWPTSVLVLPELPVSQPAARGAIDLADLVDMGGPMHVRIDSPAPIRELTPVADQVIAFVAGGRVVATAPTNRIGEAVVPPGLGASSLGVFRLGVESPADPLAAIEQRVAILRPGERPLVLFDAELADDALRALIERADREGRELLAVRLRPTRSCRSIRERLRALSLPARVLDARGVLDEGEALDVSRALDPVRLARVAARLRAAGFVVAEPGPAPPAEPIAGNRIEVELDNPKARGWLLEAIARSRETVHLQVYMALDDDVGSQVGAALAAAGARGVSVRLLVDSLHAWHGSFGTQNRLLSRLSASPGVELRTSRPITEVPSLADIKQRDHRKLVVVDGRVALLGGRNLSHEYYTGFAETRLTPRAMWREVPWLDAGARVEGPAVAALAASFLEAWTGAGGAAFAIETPAPVGDTPARVIVHRGLRDARTLDTYRELIDGARAHVYVINGFPLVLELQHALLGALRRGVRVKQLVGHLTPTHDGQPFEGPWGMARTVATELVHSRADALVEEGAEVYHFTVQNQPGWDPGLGPVHPHVHAKLLSVDGERAAVGSANLDITSSYWESELMIVVEDAVLARGLEVQLDDLLAGSFRVGRDDPQWQQLARRRAWMRHWPGVLAL